MNALQAMKMQLNVAHTENGDLGFIDNDDLAEIDEMEFWSIIGRQNLSTYG